MARQTEGNKQQAAEIACLSFVPLYSFQGTSLLLGATHTQSGASVSTKSIQPHPEKDCTHNPSCLPRTCACRRPWGTSRCEPSRWSG